MTAYLFEILKLLDDQSVGGRCNVNERDREKALF